VVTAVYGYSKREFKDLIDNSLGRVGLADAFENGTGFNYLAKGHREVAL
jgi:hypothetical protein